jgi:hypothetical protein
MNRAIEITNQLTMSSPSKFIYEVVSSDHLNNIYDNRIGFYSTLQEAKSAALKFSKNYESEYVKEEKSSKNDVFQLNMKYSIGTTRYLDGCVKVIKHELGTYTHNDYPLNLSKLPRVYGN